MANAQRRHLKALWERSCPIVFSPLNRDQPPYRVLVEKMETNGGDIWPKNITKIFIEMTAETQV